MSQKVFASSMHIKAIDLEELPEPHALNGNQFNKQRDEPTARQGNNFFLLLQSRYSI